MMPVGLYAVFYRRPGCATTIFLVDAQTGSEAADDLRSAVPGGSVESIEYITTV